MRREVGVGICLYLMPAFISCIGVCKSMRVREKVVGKAIEKSDVLVSTFLLFYPTLA